MLTLVTGGNGFIGRYIVEQLLARGDRVRVLGRNDYPELRALGAECFKLDLAAQQDCGPALKGCEVVFHVAAKAGVWGSFDDYYRNNVTATQHLVRAAIAAGVPKFVFTSSPSVVFGDDSVEGVDETAPYPETFLAPYPHTKSIAERFVLAQTEILTTAIRPPLVWGPRDPHILPRLIDRARSGRLRRIGDGTNKVDVTYVENAAEAHLLAADRLSADSPVRGRAYFIGQENAVLLWDFINTLVTNAGCQPIRGSVSYPLALNIATVLEKGYQLVGSKEEPPFTRLTVTGLAKSRWFNLAAARRDLGYGPRISTEEGMRRTVAALRG
ncbi:MAG: NAD-dependent epimerase/dehydratase family protein [Chloroflexaceae bacterium]|nr:NAD-dependent epimerase/dehydratase family protein [Chloroflexaceae bacterium]